MEYKIMRLVSKPNSIFLDLYNESLQMNIELAFCFYGKKEKFKSFINYIHFCAKIKQDVSAVELIRQYEAIMHGLNIL